MRFSRIHDFDLSPECSIFTLLDVFLVHGWLPDPVDTPLCAATGGLTRSGCATRVSALSSDAGAAAEAAAGAVGVAVAAVATGAAAGAAAGTGGGTFLATQESKSAWLTILISIGMKACSGPQSSEHSP